MEKVQQENIPETASSPEMAELAPEQALGKEKSLLEKFTSKARKAANLMALVSALAAAPAVVQEASAQTAPETKAEHVEKDAIDEAKVTESGKWSRDILEKAQSELSQVKTPEDAVWFMKSNVGEFVKEYFSPTKGNIKKETAYGIELSKRICSDDDYKLILQSAKSLKDMLQGLNSAYHMPGADTYISNLDRIIVKVTQDSSYAGKKQRELLNNSDRILNDYYNR